MDNLDDCTTKEELESCPDNILSKEAQLLIDNGGELNGCGDVIRFRTTHSMYVFEYKLHSNMLTIDTSEYDYTPSHRVELILYPISGVTFIESLKAIITYLTNIKLMIESSTDYKPYEILLYVNPDELYDIAMKRLTMLELDCLVNMLNNVVTEYSK